MTDLTGEAPRQRFCPSCGTQSDIDWLYCAGCGGRLPRIEDLHGRVSPERPSAAEPVIEPAPEPVIEPAPAASETDVDQFGPDHPAPPVEPPASGIGDDDPAPPAEYRRTVPTPPAEPRNERHPPPRQAPRRPRGRNDFIAALIEGPGAGDRDRQTAIDGPDGDAADPQVPISVTGADDPDREDDAPDDREVAGEIHLEPLSEGTDDIDADAHDGPRQGRVTTYVQFAAIASAALGVTVVAGLVRLNRRLSSFAATGEAGPVEDADRLVGRVFQPAFVVCVVVLLAGLVWWTRRRRVDLHTLGYQNSRFSDGLAAGSWLIPGANLVLPPMVLDELWRTSCAVRRREEWGDQPANPWLWVWAVIMGSGVVVAIAAAAASPSSVAGTIDANTWSGIGYALMSLALLVLVLTMSAVATTVRFSLRFAGLEDGSDDADLVVPDPVTT